MPHDKPRPYDGGPAYPGTQQEIHLQPDETRPYQIVQQPMNGMSIRDVATLQILSALIGARSKTQVFGDGYKAEISTPIQPEWIIEAMDAADTWLEMREQV